MASGMEQHMSTPMSTCGISSPDKMSTDNGELVWFGFIDFYPVIGSVKEAVEFVLAVASGDSVLANEKERMMKVRLGLEEETPSQSSMGSSSGYFSGKEAEADYEEDVPLRKLLNKIHDEQRKSQKPQSKKDEEKLKEIDKEIQKRIQLIYPNFVFPMCLGYIVKGSDRGEHVINNNVINFHFKLVEDYLINRTGQTSLDVSCPLIKATQDAIMYEMVAHFEADELYINANALVFVIYIFTLGNALLGFLQDGSQEWKDRASFVIQNMNQCNAYVDIFAKEKWIQNSARKLQKFIAARNEVAEMFADTRGTEFFERLRNGILSTGDE